MNTASRRGESSIIQRSRDSLTIVIDAPSDSTGKRRRRRVTIKRRPGETDQKLFKRVQAAQRRLAVERDKGALRARARTDHSGPVPRALAAGVRAAKAL